MAPPSALSESVYNYGTLVLKVQREIDRTMAGGSRFRASCAWLRTRDFLFAFLTRPWNTFPLVLYRTFAFFYYP